MTTDQAEAVPSVRISADGRIQIAYDRYTVWERGHYGEWDLWNGPRRTARATAPREVMDLWNRAVTAALALNGAVGPTEAALPRVVDLR